MAIHNLGPKMKSVAIFEAKNRFSELISTVMQGEEVTITRHRAPVARLVAINATPPSSVERQARVASQMRLLNALGRDAILGCDASEAIAQGRD